MNSTLRRVPNATANTPSTAERTGAYGDVLTGQSSSVAAVSSLTHDGATDTSAAHDERGDILSPLAKTDAQRRFRSRHFKHNRAS